MIAAPVRSRLAGSGFRNTQTSYQAGVLDKLRTFLEKIRATRESRATLEQTFEQPRRSAGRGRLAAHVARRGREEDAMSAQSWNRREVLKGVTAAALVGAHASPVAAQSVKWSTGTEAPKLKAPANATDCHHHIYNAKYPVDPRATLRPGDALVDDYRALQKRIGTTRNVLVQPSTYGTDNRCHLEALAAFGPTARMVAVVDDTVSTEELKRMHALGVRASASTWRRPAPPRPR
jgi:Amidohydrolase